MAEARSLAKPSADVAPRLPSPGLCVPLPPVEPFAIAAPIEHEPVATLLPPTELPPCDDAQAAESIAPAPGQSLAIVSERPAKPAEIHSPREWSPDMTAAAENPQPGSTIEGPALSAPAPLVAAAGDTTPDGEALPVFDDAPALVSSPTGAVICKRAEAKIRRGYALMQRGAAFAARSEFIGALQLIAEGKDRKHGSPRRTIALANGLRAIDEAADFQSRGAAAEAQASNALIVSAHRTPVAKGADARLYMPAQLADRYFQYAQLQLGAAVAGEPAGSMALHALGKLHTQLARFEPDRHPQAERTAFALQRAAILARGDNYLALHELGVLLAESGHYGEAEQRLGDVAMRAPNEVVLRNLARVQRKLGRDQLAAATEQHAQSLANGAGQNRHGVVWVNPTTLARTGDATAPPRALAATPPPANNPYAPNHQPPQHNAARGISGWFR